MPLLLNPRLLIALVLALVLSFGGLMLYRAGKANVRAQWDAAKVVQLAAAAQAEAKNRDTERKLQDTAAKAQNDATTRSEKLQVDAASARAESGRLRNSLAAITAKLPSLTRTAVDNYAATATAVLDSCQQQYQAVAAKADGHASDTQTLIEAWPNALR